MRMDLTPQRHSASCCSLHGTRRSPAAGMEEGDEEGYGFMGGIPGGMGGMPGGGASFQRRPAMEPQKVEVSACWLAAAAGFGFSLPVTLRLVLCFWLCCCFALALLLDVTYWSCTLLMSHQTSPSHQACCLPAPPRPAPPQVPLNLTLEELYTGCTKRRKVTRTIVDGASGKTMPVRAVQGRGGEGRERARAGRCGAVVEVPASRCAVVYTCSIPLGLVALRHGALKLG